MPVEVYARIEAHLVAEGMHIPHPETSQPAEVIRRTDVYGGAGICEIWLWVDEHTMLRVRPDDKVAVWRKAAVS